MPIEIKELHIKINVSEGGKSGGAGEGASGSASTDATQQAVEEVMNLLRQQKER